MVLFVAQVLWVLPRFDPALPGLPYKESVQEQCTHMGILNMHFTPGANEVLTQSEYIHWCTPNNADHTKSVCMSTR